MLYHSIFGADEVWGLGWRFGGIGVGVGSRLETVPGKKLGEAMGRMNGEIFRSWLGLVGKNKGSR